jgi:hypothetical protein
MVSYFVWTGEPVQNEFGHPLRVPFLLPVGRVSRSFLPFIPFDFSEKRNG